MTDKNLLKEAFIEGFLHSDSSYNGAAMGSSWWIEEAFEIWYVDVEDA